MKCIAPRRSGGFTIMEFVVCIAIIAALLAFIVSTLLQARERGRQTACLGNLGQLYQAFALYAHDNDGLLPPYQNDTSKMMAAVYAPKPGEGGKRGIIEIPERGKELVAALHPYTKNEDIWFCPADYLARTDSTDGSIRHRFSSYKVGVLLAIAPIPGARVRVTLDGGFHQDVTIPPSRLRLLTDAIWRGDVPRFVRYSHSMRFNHLYLDGHIKTMPWEPLTGRKPENQ